MKNSTNYLFLEFDKAGAEWVVVAYLANDARMIDVVQSGKKPHAVTGSLISKVPYDLVLKEYELVGKATSPDIIDEIRREKLPELFKDNITLRGVSVGPYFLPRIFSIYQCGKKSNHALNYKEGYSRFALENEMDESESKIIVNAYSQEAYTNLPAWWEAEEKQLRKDRTLYNCFGRKRVFRDGWSNELIKSAIAFKPQSTVVDLVNRGMRRAYADSSELFSPLELLLQEHDELLWQYPLPTSTKGWKRVADLCIRLGLDYMNDELNYSGNTFRLGTSLKIGKKWGDDYMVEVPLIRSAAKVAASLTEAWERCNAKASETT